MAKFELAVWSVSLSALVMLSNEPVFISNSKVRVWARWCACLKFKFCGSAKKWGRACRGGGGLPSFDLPPSRCLVTTLRTRIALAPPRLPVLSGAPPAGPALYSVSVTPSMTVNALG